LRAALEKGELDRYAGRFVWLALDLDKPQNRTFIVAHGGSATPTLFVLDPSDQRATATQLGGLTTAEFSAFLERGERGAASRAKAPADAKLARRDELLARNQPGAAAAAYGEALRVADRSWPERDRAVGANIGALMSSRQTHKCAETAVVAAPTMRRSAEFGRVVLSGLTCANDEGSAASAAATRRTLESLAVEAIGVQTILRDHRFQLYQQLMIAAQARKDETGVKRWGDQWLHEVDAGKPANDDERSALDIARVDVASLLDDPSRVLPALQASERAMPNNYNASLRLAQMQNEAKRYAEAIAACDRGLAHVTGPLGRTWLLQTKAEALIQLGQTVHARRTLESALTAAQAIGLRSAHDRNVARVSSAIASLEKREE
jgi:tetratricopeptide (TPR) repeat protein